MLFNHVTVGTNDLEKAKRFYDATFTVVDAVRIETDLTDRILYKKDNQMFAAIKPIDGNKATYANGGTIGFSMSSVEQVNKWYQAGIENGGEAIEAPPGIRDGQGPKKYLAYLRDPDGNKLCAFYLVK
ncbi:VOC family protein [Commensalibacter oyaizuii]|uniref:VOC family protein n=1 Tax=Commensalibacter oyaizuii TaxID=3043873 RepID=A0ABT6PY91_9PROT|nr:VOC family protein [Commensalibacter sp. TBRC 16381]MDI2089817.1 VOC family protein [Commensalibacter sp. TBRC 16381]